MQHIWDAAKGHVVGDVRLEGDEIVARHSHERNRHGDKHIRSELIYTRFERDEVEDFDYCFLLTGNLNDKETIIFQFHDHWDIPPGITIEGKQFLYAKVAPPICFMIIEDDLFVRYAVATSQPLLNLEQKWLEFNYSVESFFYRKIVLDEPITLNFRVKWSAEPNGYFKSRELNILNMATMYNNRTPIIQCGLYGSGYCDDGITVNRIQNLAISKLHEDTSAHFIRTAAEDY